MSRPTDRGAAESLRCETRLTWCRTRQLVTARGRQRTDSPHILAAVWALNRIEVVGDTRRHALHTLAVVAPEWWRAASHPDWQDHDARRAEDDRRPTTHAARATLALTMGHDGRQWLSAVDHAEAPLAARDPQRREHDGVDLRGPTRLDDPWQALEGGGCDAQHCQVAWAQPRATCPAGKASISRTPAIDHRKHAVITVTCSRQDGRSCAHVSQCIRSQQRSPRRTLTMRPQPPYQALQTARQREATEAFQTADAQRAGIEGTTSRETRSMRRRRTRDIGLRRVHLGHILAAVGLNVLRLGEWFLDTTHAQARMTPFARLIADAPAA